MEDNTIICGEGLLYRCRYVILKDEGKEISKGSKIGMMELIWMSVLLYYM
jgi:hypothetical protein